MILQWYRMDNAQQFRKLTMAFLIARRLLVCNDVVTYLFMNVMT